MTVRDGMAALVVGGVLMATVAVRAEDPAAAGNATATFLGPEAGRGRCRLELQDVHGLWGGNAVFVEHSGRCVVRVVGPGQDEKRYAWKLEPAAAAAFFAMCIESDLVALQIKERPGIPDEGHPVLVLLDARGRAHRVGKWQSDKVPAFDRIYEALLALAKQAEAQKPEFTGKFEWDWRPWEAVVVTVSMFSGRPDPTFELTDPADWEKLREFLIDLPDGPKLQPPQLGYRGMILVSRGVENFQPHLAVWKGTIEIEVDQDFRACHKDEKGMEAWLLAEAKQRGIEVR
ncbi:MAG: hypothetical protein HZA54_02715 [Planctomycetes bacterium]|nr:hypothetical protein [Planctomycetota bacterium]